MNMDREIVDLYVDDIIPNRFQPREIFEDKALKELSISIKEHGVIQPIIVRKIGDKYEIVAGERRYKASVMAGLTRIPSIIRNLDDKESSKVALLENLQRRDLSAIEEARTYQKILDLDSMTQEELGRTMGKSQAAIANKLRLLALPDEVQEALLTSQISERHARSLLNIKNSEKQIEVLKKIIATRMTVRELDLEIKMLNGDTSPLIEEEEEGEQKTIVPPTYHPIMDMNPLSNTYEPVSNIDINTLRSQATDIIDRPQENARMEDLLKIPESMVMTQPQQEEKTFKFIPEFIEEDSATVEAEQPNFEWIANTPVEQTQPLTEEANGPVQLESPRPVMIDEIEKLEEEKNDITPSYMPFANTEALINEFRQNNGQPPMQHPAAMVESSPIVVNDSQVNIETQITDLKTVINTIRDMVRKIEENGFVIDLDEMDFENTYQITMKIDKNK